MFLESERLIIRDALVSDAPFYFELFNDPDWIEYINDKGLRTLAATKAYLEDILPKNKALNGLGFFTVILKETNTPIGTTTALQRDTLDFVDIGYAFLPQGRGKGYAKEATQVTLHYVKEKFKQEKVYAFTLPHNLRSQKLLKNLGFTYVGLKTIFGNEKDAVYEYIFP